MECECHEQGFELIFPCEHSFVFDQVCADAFPGLLASLCEPYLSLI
jgi:hypothetical protein